MVIYFADPVRENKESGPNKRHLGLSLGGPLGNSDLIIE